MEYAGNFPTYTEEVGIVSRFPIRPYRAIVPTRSVAVAQPPEEALMQNPHLKLCPNCQDAVPLNAPTCPGCGMPLPATPSSFLDGLPPSVQPGPGSGPGAPPAWPQPMQPAAPPPMWPQPMQPVSPPSAWQQPGQLGAPPPAWTQPGQPENAPPAWQQPIQTGNPPPPWQQAPPPPWEGGPPQQPPQQPWQQQASNQLSQWNQSLTAGNARPRVVQGNRTTIALCAIFLGGLGIHKFMLGMKTPGLILLLGTVLTCGAGAIVTSIIGIVEGVIYFSKTDADFHATYVQGTKEWF